MRKIRKSKRRETMRIYMGADPNFKGQKCKILNQTGDTAYVVFADDDLLGTTKTEIDMKYLI